MKIISMLLTVLFSLVIVGCNKSTDQAASLAPKENIAPATTATTETVVPFAEQSSAERSTLAADSVVTTTEETEQTVITAETDESLQKEGETEVAK